MTIEKILSFIENNQSHMIFILSILVAILIILIIVLLIRNSILTNKYRQITNNGKETDLEKIILDNKKELSKIIQMQEYLNKKIESHIYKERKAFKKLRIHNYDAFDKQTGKLSFILVMLDEENTGFIINNVHNMDFNYTYIKEIEGGQAKTRLSSEEESVLEEILI